MYKIMGGIRRKVITTRVKCGLTKEKGFDNTNSPMPNTNDMTNAAEPSESIGRNEPCPCGSGKKYKRCCGVSAPPKLSSQSAQNAALNGADPNQFDPQMMAQMTELLRKLPKGQMQKLQALMQKAMSGKDVSRDAQALEGSLPVEFQQLLQDFSKKYPDSETPEAPVKKESKFSQAWKNLFKKK